MAARHPIARYCDRHAITRRQFAARAGLSESLISQIIAGTRRPGAEAIRCIVKAGRGEITERELLWWKAAA